MSVGNRSFRYVDASSFGGGEGSGNRVTVGTASPPDPIVDDVWIQDISNSPAPGHTVTVYERGSTAWREEFSWNTGASTPYTEAEALAAARTVVVDWAETDNALPIPAAKLVNAPGGGDDAWAWAEQGNTDDIPLSKLALAPGGVDPPDVESWALAGDQTLIPQGKVNYLAVQVQIDEIHEQLAHSAGDITEIVGVAGGGGSSLRYALPTGLDGLYDLSVTCEAMVQINEFVNFSGSLNITADGGLGLNATIPFETHNYHHQHRATFNFLRKGLAISPGANLIDFTAFVTGATPPSVVFIHVSNMKLTDTSLVNSGNVNPFIADWAETDNALPIPAAKLVNAPGGGDDAFDWATVGNTDAIPADKLTNAPAGEGGTPTPTPPVVLLDGAAYTAHGNVTVPGWRGYDFIQLFYTVGSDTYPTAVINTAQLIRLSPMFVPIGRNVRWSLTLDAADDDVITTAASTGNGLPVPTSTSTLSAIGWFAGTVVDGGGGAGGPEAFGTATLAITDAVTFYTTGLTLPMNKTWAFFSMGAHTEDVQGVETNYAPGPWLRILISDLLGLPDITLSTTPTAQNAIHSEIELQNSRELDVGTTAAGLMLVSIPHKNADSTIAGDLRVRVA